jgi:hypothetical protein
MTIHQGVRKMIPTRKEIENRVREKAKRLPSEYLKVLLEANLRNFDEACEKFSKVCYNAVDESTKKSVFLYELVTTSTASNNDASN